MTTPILKQVVNLDAEKHFKNAQHFVDCRQDDKAIAHLFRAITLEPTFAMGHLLLGEILLRRGEYRPGWLEFEWGSRYGMISRFEIKAPQWNGMRLGSGILLLVCSQGYGDIIQFARYIPFAAERCAKIVVACDPDIASLVNSIPGVSHVFTNWSETPSFAAYAPLTSLPMIFGTEIENIPFANRYLFADQSRVQSWRGSLREFYGKKDKLIGLVWAGRPTHPNDKRRSMPLATLLPILKLQNISIVIVQKMVPENDKMLIDIDRYFMAGSALGDFSETAALIENLDLLITVDSSVAHLAGALGKPVWILLPYISDWRWSTDRQDSPWYSSARLFRQSQPDDWTTCVDRIVQELIDWG